MKENQWEEKKNKTNHMLDYFQRIGEDVIVTFTISSLLSGLSSPIVRASTSSRLWLRGLRCRLNRVLVEIE